MIEVIDTHCHVEPWFLAQDVNEPDPTWFKDMFAETKYKTRLLSSSTGRNPVLIGEGNVAAVRKLAKLIEPFPDKIIGSIMVDPHDREGALEAVELGVKKLGMRCVGELVQYIHGWRTDGFEILPVIQLAVELDVPLMFHVSDEGHAEGVARLAEKFPKANIIAAHSAGGRGWRRGMEIVKDRPNIWIEVMRGNREQIRTLLKLVGATRITYGTDFGVHQDPALRYTAGNWLIECLEDLGCKGGDIERIAGRNAKELLKLED